MIKEISVFVIFVIFVACSAPVVNQEDSNIDIPDSVYQEGMLEISEEAFENIIHNLSSPVEMAVLIKALDIPFSIKYLRPEYDPTNYTTNYEMALGMGFLGADLALLNIYNQSVQVDNYRNMLDKLAEELKVGQFFESSNDAKKNRDSITFLSVSSFNRMNSYLRQNKRSNISALVISGLWLESTYHAVAAVQRIRAQELVERIGEQKMIINELIIVLQNYRKDENINELLTDFREIKKAYDGVKITYTLGEPEAMVVNGVLTITQNERSDISISDQQLENIISLIEKVRNKLVHQ